MNYRLSAIMVTLAMILTMYRPAFAQTIIFCPAEYDTLAIKVLNPPEGWTPVMAATLPLNAAGVMKGVLDVRSIMKPERRELKKGFDEIYFGLGGGKALDKWIWCGYGIGNEVMLTKPLDREIRQCTVSYRPEFMALNNKVHQILCK